MIKTDNGKSNSKTKDTFEFNTTNPHILFLESRYLPIFYEGYMRNGQNYIKHNFRFLPLPGFEIGLMRGKEFMRIARIPSQHTHRDMPSIPVKRIE